MSASINVLAPRPSLLDRRASNNIPDLPAHLSVADLLSHNPQSFIPSSSSLNSRASPRSARPPPAFLSFVPLTPIMASPLLTPEVARAPTPVATFETAVRQLAPPVDGSPESDYINHHPSPPNPTWTTSPPTPPPKHSSSPRLASSTNSSPARSIRHRSKSQSTNVIVDRSGPHPASVAYFASPSSLSRSFSASSPSAALGVSAQFERVPVRRLSLPSDLSKPLPLPPGEFLDGALEDLPPVAVRCDSAQIDAENDRAQTLLPSLSRRAPVSHGRGASLGSIPDETDTLRSVGKKLFNLDADEGDLSEEDEPELGGAYKEEDRPARGDLNQGPGMGQTRVREQEKASAERLRRHHALMELLSTEVGYLLDLRALVTVYLDQLLLLSSPPTTPPAATSTPLSPPLSAGLVPPPSRTLSTFSVLSIPSLFPNARSSVVLTSSSSTNEVGLFGIPDVSIPQERERHSSGGSDPGVKERDREKENLDRIHSLKMGKPRPFGPVLIEREVRAVCRNAQELLKFHERFVGELRDAVSGMGFRGVFGVTAGEEQPVQNGGEEKVTEDFERAVEVVAAKFVSEAASFSIYETFCPGHAAATDLLRRVQERWPTVWDSYEQRCAQIASSSAPAPGEDEQEQEVSSPASPLSENEDSPDCDPDLLRRRRHSTPVLSLAFPASPPSFPRTQLPFPASNPPSSFTSPRPPAERRNASKLKFMDYLIKPVQRICKYPLLLDQLLDKRRKVNGSSAKASPSDASAGPVDDAVRKAGEAMRGVVSRVNHASEKEAHNLRSALIASRIAFSNAPLHAGSSSMSPPSLPSSSALPPVVTAPSSSEGTTSSHGRSNSVSSCSAVSTAPTSPGLVFPAAVPPAPRPTSLTADFVSSLGPCMLAGALDVIQYPSHRAKYMGAFLYAGGYCILAKVTKNGRVYEPRHWFSFAEVEVLDVEEDDASFPYSFRVSGYGDFLEIAASCGSEKAIWMSAINDSLSAKVSWRNEPLSSLQGDDKTPPSGPLAEEPQEIPGGLPTIQSLSDLERESDAHNDSSVSPPAANKLKYSKTLSRLDGLALKHDAQSSALSAALSRRSSTASVKAFFSPITTYDPTRIQRPSLQSRVPIEQGLHDVFSESCLAARAQAQVRGEELFQVRAPLSGGGRRQGSGMSRSNSGLSIASAMGFTAAKRKYDMVSRRNRSVDLDMPAPPVSAAAAADHTTPAVDAGTAPGIGPSSTPSAGLTMRARTLAVRRHKKQPASIAPAISTAIAQMNAEQHGQATSSSSALFRSPEALSLDSPPDASHCSSVSSILPSPVDSSPLPIPVPGLSPNGTLRQSDVSPIRSRSADAHPKRARSMVDNVRYFFQPPRADSPTASSSSDPDRSSPTRPQPLPLGVDGPPPAECSSSTGIVHWLRRTSIRRRLSGSSSTPSSASADDHMQHKRPVLMRNSTDGIAVPRPEFLDVSSPGCSGFRSVNANPKRHRSLFVPSSRSRDRMLSVREKDRGREVREVCQKPPAVIVPQTPTSAAAVPASSSGGSPLPARKSLRNLLLFQRSTSMTPVG